MKPSMTARVKSYLDARRALGYKLHTEGGMLLNFARYADRTQHQSPLTSVLALRWATLPRRGDPLYRARRLEVVRVFAKYLATLEPATEIPPRHVLGPAHKQRRRPHFYTTAQILSLMSRAAHLHGRLWPQTYRTLIGLLSCSGLRISEALSLGVSDFDLSDGLLVVRESKYHRTRLVPLHPTCVEALRRYVSKRTRLFPNATRFFVSDRGTGLAYSTVRTVFRELAGDIQSTSERRHVRLHDLRHTFACRVLLRWQHSRRGAAGRVIILSRYLGHERVSDTYWYLTAIPELLRGAGQHFQSPEP